MDDTSKGGNLMPDANSVFAPKPAGWQRTGHWIATADFPKPLMIAGLKYWDASESRPGSPPSLLSEGGPRNTAPRMTERP
jgi:hypothetical protein